MRGTRVDQGSARDEDCERSLHLSTRTEGRKIAGPCIGPDLFFLLTKLPDILFSRLCPCQVALSLPGQHKSAPHANTHGMQRRQDVGDAVQQAPREGKRRKDERRFVSFCFVDQKEEEEEDDERRKKRDTKRASHLDSEAAAASAAGAGASAGASVFFGARL